MAWALRLSFLPVVASADLEKMSISDSDWRNVLFPFYQQHKQK